MRSLSALLPVTSLLLVCFGSAAASDNPFSGPPEELWDEGEFTEGVAVRSDGTVFFSDIPGGDQPGRILQFDPKSGRTTVFSRDSRKSNGLFFDSDDRLLACCGADGGARALCEVTAGGSVRPLAESWNGRRFNSPNDLVVHPNGTVYFSDPRYRGSEPMEFDRMLIWKRDPGSGAVTPVETGIEKPNGVHVSPDGLMLYVAETNNGSTGLPGSGAGPAGRMTLNAFDIAADGSLGNRRVLADYGSETGVDGMTVHPDGRIFAAVRSQSRHGIAVYSPEGDELAFLETDRLPTNCCFGVGKTADVLYMTVGSGLYRVDVSD